jgi:hypothetical protein
MIMGTGFKNTVAGSNITGYQVDVRIPYYRGVYLSAIESITLSVDGKPAPREAMQIVVHGRTFTLDQAEEAGDTRWFFGDPATLRVQAPGGLKPGLHTVEVGMAIRKSYFPATDPEHVYNFFGLWQNGVFKSYHEPPTVVAKKMTLVQ